MKKPKDVTSLLGGSASFEVSLSHDDIPVKWMFNNTEIKPSTSYQILSESKSHKLVVPNVTSNNAGEYTALAGKLQCSANLHVECKFFEGMIIWAIIIFFIFHTQWTDY